MGFTKWISGGIGWAFGGPIGGILGFALGSIFESMNNAEFEAKPNQKTRQTQSGDFGISLLVLCAAVMKADGIVKKSELDYVKKFFTSQFGTVKTKQYLLALREILKQEIPLKQVCVQITQNMPHPMRLQLLHLLFGIAKADGVVDLSEVNTIQTIGNYLNISQKDFDSLKAMFYKDSKAAYKILEILPNATEDEVKKAYRKMAVKYHPDKVAQLGDDFQQAAKEKFLKVQEAYEDIKRERGFK